MRLLADTPIKRKLIVINMIISGVAIFVSCLVFVISDFRRQHGVMIADLATTATILADNSTASLSFNDPDSAKQTLNSLTTRPYIVGAAIYDKDGKVFATYSSGVGAVSFTAPPPQADGHSTNSVFTTLFRGIELGGERIGTIYLQLDMTDARARLNYYIYMLVLMIFVATGTAFLLSSRLQKTISAPIYHLAGVVHKVAAENNYALRAVKQGEDEMGSLIDGFNEMLNQLQQRDLALQEAHNHLEKRVEERTKELANSLSLLNATLDSTTDGIIAVSKSGEVICCNSQYVAMWGMDCAPPENQPNTAAVAFIAARVKNPDEYLQRVEFIKTHSDIDAFDVLELKDGRLFERFVKPQWVGGEIEGRVISFRDITERRRAEQEFENVHRQLLEASRQAGMAEVASNVLHNVGNVLNSVNVSTNLVTENMKRSKVAALAKVATLLHDHTHDLAAFITEDPKGKLLPGFLQQLCEHLRNEQHGTIKELESLRNNIDHIKEIVAMQQSYSKVSGVKEIVNVVDLIEDTLHMSEGALQRHGVSIVREFEAVPMINTEKHKILQILVNLVRNAKYACSECANPDKRITLRVTNDAEWIKIAVIDTGVGISADNLTRIFGHGFTTRKDGHGFGLHSGALAAKELGGVLHVHSDGLGLGATFTLELPKDVVPEAQCLSA